MLFQVFLTCLCLTLCSSLNLQPEYETLCSVLPWGNWSECNTKCGTGLQIRIRRGFPYLRNRSRNNPCPTYQTKSCTRYNGCKTNSSEQCSLKFNAGLCLAYFPVWSFNSETGVCQEAIYGGCGGNANRFKSKEECESQCQIAVPDTCSLKFDTGPCRARVEVWTFNSLTGVCEKANYGGCQGNANRFKTVEECQNRCIKEDTCRLKFEAGPCRAYVPVWTYISNKGICEEAVYGGCGGNSNKFSSKQECYSRCRNNDSCILKFDAGPCKAAVPVWTYNSDKGLCEEAIYGGCQGNFNRFSTKQECDSRCPNNDTCSLKFDAGSCKAAVPVWTYNSDKGLCEEAIYGGCQGNSNRFSTKQACDSRCQKNAVPDTCSLQFDAGPCRARIEVWTFNSLTGVCEKANYGGCQGNENRFKTVEECQNRCIKEDTCAIEFNAGPCKAALPVWTYNSEKGICEEAVYGGCQGNSNKFKTKEECDKHCQNKNSCSYESNTCSLPVIGEKWTYDALNKLCVKTSNSCDTSPNNFVSEESCKKVCQIVSAKDICSLPFETGPCKALAYVWAYNSTTNKCEEEIYGGCQGNANRFAGARECEQTCITNST